MNGDVIELTSRAHSSHVVVCDLEPEPQGRPPPLSHASSEIGLLAPSEDRGADVGGSKDIGFFGGVSLLFNNISGPAIVTIPVLFQQAGWFTPTVGFLVIMVISTLSAQWLCHAMSTIPGNDRFQGRIEFGSLAKHFLPRWAFIITICMLTASLMSQLVSAIIVSAQTMDIALLAMFKKTVAIEFYPALGLAYAAEAGESASPFGNAYVLSAGYVLVLIVTLPMGMWNLDDNIIIQKGAMVALVLIFVEWVIALCLLDLDFSRTPFYAPDQSLVLGTIIFNYAFVITVPSWVNEKKEDVSIKKSLWSATSLATVLYIVIGFLGAWAFKLGPDTDLLEEINVNARGSLRALSRICVYLFPPVALMSGIPVFSIIMRYNLIENRVCGKAAANFWAVVLPWVLAVVFYGGEGLLEIINWTSLLVNGFINFLIPGILYSFSLDAESRRMSLSGEYPEESATRRKARRRRTIVWVVGGLVLLGVIVANVVGEIQRGLRRR